MSPELFAPGAFTSELFASDLSNLLFWGVNALWAVVALYGLVAYRSLVVGYFFAAIWALTVCLYLAAPMLANDHLSLVDSFFLLCAVVAVAQVILELIGAIGAVFGFAKSPDDE